MEYILLLLLLAFPVIYALVIFPCAFIYGAIKNLKSRLKNL